MGGNSVYTAPARTRAKAPRKPSDAKVKLDKLVKALKDLDPTEREEAINALKGAGLGGVARALKAMLGTGSRPAERRRS